MAIIMKEAQPVERRLEDQRKITDTVARMIETVRDGRDAAVREYSKNLDGWSPASFRLNADEVRAAIRAVPATVLEDISFCQAQVRTFAEAQKRSLGEFEIETMPGVRLGQKNIPIANVGSYVPGGRYPMVASAHMSIIPAKVAGVGRIAACTPPLRGEIPAATVAAMHLAGANEIYVLGGVQAVAALALGTETIPKVDFFAGPGNAYVAEAKRQLFGEVGIDLLAGPTEILVVADETADPSIVAADLLSQAEHGPTSPAILISLSAMLADAVLAEIPHQLESLPTADIARLAWETHGKVLLVASLDEAVAEADAIASEHVEILTRDPRYFLEHMRNYGALFLGEGTTVAYGDKAIGTNHILPTNNAATYTGGLWVGKYLKTLTYQECDPAGSLAVGKVAARQCRIENFEGHARACDLRVAKYGQAAAARQFV